MLSGLLEWCRGGRGRLVILLGGGTGMLDVK